MEKEYWYIAIAAILYGTVTAGGQFFVNLGLSLYEIALYTMLLVTLMLLPVVLIKRKYLIKKEMFLFFVIYGLIGALLQIAQYGGIVLGVSVAVVALLLYSQPIWTVLFGNLILKEKITMRKITAVSIAIAGVFLLIKPWNINSVGPTLGIVSAILAGLLLSLWVIWGRKSGINKQHYITTTIGYTGFSFIWLILFWPIMKLLIHTPNIMRLSIIQPHYWLYLIIFSIIAGIIPHAFFYTGVRKIQASIAGIILLFEPVSAAILAAILFAQPIGLNVLSGGALILFSNYIITHKTTQSNAL